jgi:hypothetical protein
MLGTTENNVTYVSSVLDCIENPKVMISQPMAGKTDEEITKQD